MKTALHIDIAQLFGEPVSFQTGAFRPRLSMPNADFQLYENQHGQACLQQFDGLLGFINLLELHIPSDIVISLQVKYPDIHSFYVMANNTTIQLEDLSQQVSYPISSGRGRYFYLSTGDYRLHIPAGRYTIVNFYFRGSIFRDGNERPFRFLQPLIAAYRQKDPNTCCSIDFRIGTITIFLMKAIMAKIKKGDLDTEVNILWGIKKLINLSKEKIFEEYEKISESQLKAKEAHAIIKQTVTENGQDFKLDDIAWQLGISMDYLHQLIHSYYGLSPQELKIAFMLDLAKKYILDGMHTDTIAYELGYSSPSSFARFFKKKTGMTARDFFKRYIQDDR
ncbi:helix-turn-helix transcriptional regulator [Sphingobacterium sp. UGAL515B_05]|uniref:helix-turn-helix domain-containing protein n=1 Tax=Sphingobacterium sp. UGAL515B_05 TaxID=2986767 RepID=UPI002955413E|nr:helix-turn-helix transcriptional regulator [Sphingobacterium sp. UGAL515B_05]WON93657.1 helix-turn-helix transcriptional regulator [Sphingobacterium sp. UGAL515B_05]